MPRQSNSVRLATLCLVAIIGMVWLPHPGSAQTDPEKAWTALRRPLQVPAPITESTCPASPARPIAAELGPLFEGEPVLGTVPLFARGGLTSADTEQRYSRMASDADGWVQVKNIWYGHPVYTGPILVRGVQLDGDGSVRFEGMGATTGEELRLSSENSGTDGSGAGWRTWNTRIAVQQPGCYAWQIDGETFTTLVVFAIQP